MFTALFSLDFKINQQDRKIHYNNNLKKHAKGRTGRIPHRPAHGGSEGPPGPADSAPPQTHLQISGTL